MSGSMGGKNGPRCYVRSSKPGCALGVRSTKWKIIWKFLSFPKAKILDSAVVSSRQSCALRGRSLATEEKRNCSTTIKSAWGRGRKTGALFKHCQQDFYILEGESTGSDQSTVRESQNHRMVGVGRDLCGSSSPTPLPKQGHPQQAALDLVQAGLEYLQRRSTSKLAGLQPLAAKG